MKYIYGPVSSWRLGRSLGIDIIADGKNCDLDCTYCQLGRTREYSSKRRIFVPTMSLMAEFESLPKIKIDHITFSGSGEPTLAANLGQVITELKNKTRTKIAVLTNSTLMRDKKVRSELALADIVVAKLDAPNEKVFKLVSCPAKGVTFKGIVSGIKRFNREYPGKLALQIMFVPQNKKYAVEMARVAKEIGPVEVQVNTPLRPSGVRPLSKDEIKRIAALFRPLKVYSVYEVKRKKVSVMDQKATEKRRPEY